ncbi:hypothetical protein HPB51_003450 [Rhipicephalus microplus]|uniref:Uncharacterized protein n=1 Tax=Rhipicephalus microplus TaxID=6941 RepID=A0A9J6EX44_RHIMP|nr:hypothetical protein HPB51_003450 [Rhipicephalus microplus]
MGHRLGPAAEGQWHRLPHQPCVSSMHHCQIANYLASKRRHGALFRGGISRISRRVQEMASSLTDLIAPRMGYHGTGGELTVSSAQYHSYVLDAFLKAGEEMGYKIVDSNAGEQTGAPPSSGRSKD